MGWAIGVEDVDGTPPRTVAISYVEDEVLAEIDDRLAAVRGKAECVVPDLECNRARESQVSSVQLHTRDPQGDPCSPVGLDLASSSDQLGGRREQHGIRRVQGGCSGRVTPADCSGKGDSRLADRVLHHRESGRALLQNGCSRLRSGESSRSELDCNVERERSAFRAHGRVALLSQVSLQRLEGRLEDRLG